VQAAYGGLTPYGFITMNINSTLFLQAVVFAILVWFTMKYVWPPITKALDERAAKIADGLAAADKAKSELAQANQRVEQQLTQSRNETQQRLQDAQRRAENIVEEAKARASEEAAKIVAQAKADADQQAVKVREMLREQVAVLAVKGAEQILRKEVNASVHADLLSRLKAEL